VIYRARRLVNWCPKLNSAISDIEVDHVTLDGPTLRKVPGHTSQYEFGTMVEFAYRVAGSATGEEIVVATTRIETMLGDTAVAVHPEDPRYTHLVGQSLEHPFADRRVRVIADAQAVDMAFGTGAVKITPAHDPNDYETGLRNGLEEITVLGDDGAMAANCGRFAGLMRFDARVAVIAALEELGLLRGKRPNPMRLGICSRTGDVIEPMLKPQWYVACDNMAARAAAAVREGELTLVPDLHNATWFSWLDNPRDWCVSRQLWWGHRIPAYLVSVAGGEHAAPDPSDDDAWVVGRTAEEAQERAEARLVGDGKRYPAGTTLTLAQDPDVLDTWFSSGIFPFSVFGWPDEADPEMAAFFPTSLLETGSDILFFWVARMVMMSLHLTDKLPFSTVFLHAMVRDAHGRKMSKTLGNVIDPLDVISGITLEQLHKKLDESTNISPDELEAAKLGQTADYPEGISECGADALRYALCSYASQGRSINLDINRVTSYRAFCNKLWNATRFVLTNLGDGYSPPASAEFDPAALGTADAWVLSRASAAAREVRAAFDCYDFGAATHRTHSFFLGEICDVYLEMVKGVMRGEDAAARDVSRHVLYTVVDIGLRLLHPFMPYVTEELWQRLGRREGETVPSIMIAAYPAPLEAWDNAEVEQAMAVVMASITGARSLRNDNKLTPSQKPPLYITVTAAVEGTNGVPAEQLGAWLRRQAADIALLANASRVTVILEGDGAEPEAGCGIAVIDDRLSVHMGLKGLINVDEEVQKLTARLETLLKSSGSLETRMGTDNYLKVPEKVREADKVKLEAMKQEIGTIQKGISDFEALK
jgi:valyl-tRNA synthetase